MDRKVIISADARQMDGTLTEVRSGSHTWYIDEPPFFNGEDRAPSPVQALLGALAGCIVAAGYQAAREMELPLCGLRCTLSGQICPDRFFGRVDSGERAGFSDIHVELSGSTGWTDAQRGAWMEQMVDRCPIADDLMRGTSVRFSWGPRSD